VSNPPVFFTVTVHQDTPMNLKVGEHTALVLLGDAETVTLEFQSVRALEQLQECITTGLATMPTQTPGLNPTAATR
jgi:hypothetical protein